MNNYNNNKNKNNNNNYLILRTGLGQDLLYQIKNIKTEPVYNLYQYVELKTGIQPKLHRFLYGSKFLDPRKLLGDYNIQQGSSIDFKVNLKGGFPSVSSITKPIFRKIEGFGNAILDGIKSIFGPIADFFEDLGRIFIWLYKFLIWLAVDVLNPSVWIGDAIQGLFDGVRIVIMFMLSIILTFVKYGFNKLLGPVFSNIWGYDMNDKNNKCKKCFSNKTGSLPFSVILGTILLPPLGVFMELGLTGWVNILICTLLTAAFYFPGLIYALTLLYC